MNLYELFRELAQGELSNLALAEGGGTILEVHRPKILGYINEGLTRIYSRFVLKENDLLLEMIEGQTLYPLESKYAASCNAPCEPENEYLDPCQPFILDMGRKPFKDDLIKVLSVYNSFGMRLPLNKPHDPLSVFTPRFNLLQIPYPVCSQGLSLEYQARHPVVSLDEACDEIELPFFLVGALKSYVAYLAFHHMNTVEMMSKSAQYLQDYELICLDIEAKGLIPTSMEAPYEDRFTLQGWV